MLTQLQKGAAEAIVNIYETSRVRGNYGLVTLIPGDTGHLTYGRSQTTLASGNLFLLLKAYSQASDASLGQELAAFLPRVEATDLSLDHDQDFRRLLGTAGDDPVMQREQDAFFDRVYWAPAVTSANFIGATTALGTAVVYDSRVHGSWHRIRDRTIDRHGKLVDLGEEVWITHYVAERHHWLANHSNSILHATVYRMEGFKGLMDAGKLDLALPFTLRGVTVDEAVLTGPPPVRVSAAAAGERLLRLRQPFMKGADVRELQTALISAGHVLDADGVFGPATEVAVKAAQQAGGLVADGIVGPATLAALGL
jgi:chitosanase